jgi:hypothetical protein
MNQRILPNNYLTLIAVSALSFICACVAHEAIGHGGMCLLVGGKIKLITTVYFRYTATNTPLVDAAGPSANLLAGFICLSFLKKKNLSQPLRLFLFYAMAFNLFWGSGYFIFSAITRSGDLYFVIRDLNMSPLGFWKIILGAAGIILYYLSIRIVSKYSLTGLPLIIPYLTAGITACVSVLFFRGEALHALHDAALESFGAGIGLVIIYFMRGRRNAEDKNKFIVERSAGWQAASLIITIIFILTMGIGMKFGN